VIMKQAPALPTESGRVLSDDDLEQAVREGDGR